MEKKCDKCEKSFLFENTLKLHMKNIHESGVVEGSRDCPDLLIETSNLHKQNTAQSISNVQDKSEVCVPQKIQNCVKCSFRSGDPSLFWAHVVIEHPDVPSSVFYCGYSHCWFPFTSFKMKEAHEMTIHGGLHLPFKCLLCKKSFANKTAVETHRSKCIRRPFFKCPCAPCDFQTNRFIQLSKHVERSHHQDLLLVDKKKYTFHHPGWSKSSESEDADINIKSEDDDVSPQSAGESVSVQKASKDLLYRIKEDIKSDEEEEIVLSGTPQTGPAPTLAPPFQCPYDTKTFSSFQLLHRHIHSSHLETGTDMGDCPIGQDRLSCICGRKTNCRHSLVVHSIRCLINLENSLEGGNKRDEDDEALEEGWVVAKRRALRKCKELGLTDKAMGKYKLGMLDMCHKVSARKLDMTGKKMPKEKVSIQEPVVEVSDDDSSTEPEPFSIMSSPHIAPAKRKSAISSQKSKSSRTCPKKKKERKIVSVSSGEDQSEQELEPNICRQMKVKCPICEKVFDRNYVMEHFCEYEMKEEEVLEVSSGSEIDISEDDSAVTTASEATSEEDTPIKTNYDMLSMLQDIRNSPIERKSTTNVVTLSTSGFSFDLSYSLPPTPSTPSPTTMSRQGQGAKRTRAKLSRKGYAQT